MPKVTLEYKKKMKQAIIEAAISNFSKYGYAKSGMDEIAESARVSTGTLYLYFPSKEDLFYSVCRYFDDVLLREELIVFDDKNTLRSDIARFYDSEIQILKDFDRILVDAVSESKQNLKLRRILRQEWNTNEEMIYDMLYETKKRGVFLKNCTNLQAIAIAVIALYDGLAMNRMTGHDFAANKKAFIEAVYGILTSEN